MSGKRGTPLDSGDLAFIAGRLVTASANALKGHDAKKIIEAIKNGAPVDEELSGLFGRLLNPQALGVAKPLGRIIGESVITLERGKYTVEQMAGATGCVRYDGGYVNSTNLPHDAGCPEIETVTIKWVEFGQSMDSDPIVADLALQGLKPMTSDHTLAVGIQHPTLQLERPRVGLGSSGVRPRCGRCVSVLGRCGGGRGLSLGGWGGEWFPVCVFGAVQVAALEGSAPQP